MATLYRYPCFFSLSSRKISLNQEDFKINWNTHYQHYPPQKHFRICVCEAKKSRGRRKVKSNAELCNDIREFVSAVGLPEGHVPSMKELSNHGRNDLAHIVRRRGYKLLKDLLSNYIKAETDGSNAKKSLAEGHDMINGHADIPAGPDEKVEDVVEDSSFSTEVPIISVIPDCNSSDHSSMPTESLVRDVTSLTNSYSIQQQDEEVEYVVEDSSLSFHCGSAKQQGGEVSSMADDNSLSTEVLVVDNSYCNLNGYPSLNFDGNTCMPVETPVNFSSEEKALNNSEVQDEKVNIVVEDISFPAGVLNSEHPANNADVVPGLNLAYHSYIPMNPAANSSLEDKVARFILNGDLDAIEDNVHGMFDGNTEGPEGFNQPRNENEIQSKTPSEENFAHAVSRSNTALALNWSTFTSEHIMSPARVNFPIRNNGLPAEGSASSDLDKDLDVETSKRENQVEIDHLKFMLHQKELELSRLKEQIKKEQLALSDLQAKAETEISKAQKLISEKDAELLAAEEGLSGLVEVKIQYSGDGEIVEVAGSFNGWHERIKMDPQPSSSVPDTGSRKSKLWSTMLWLYPGAYEIKFIVDGQWRIDPHRESVTRGGISNNVLRVVG
ncbi:protein PTST homolog 3, chloroplastic isoform X2 [Jatropha curcas]|uniref:protein PTST homolog 3, chloroplastic isoform X2 n=1 Tax=Jatropha curcas TaxID=180498 RepID=UPI0005FB8DA8|nr:protein PTST homolog 3, chloroplastic isoform X2 [Jatropha curcas]